MNVQQLNKLPQENVTQSQFILTIYCPIVVS